MSTRTKAPTKAELRAMREARRQAEAAAAAAASGAPAAAGEGEGQQEQGLVPAGAPAEPVFAQGRPQPMLRLEDLPDPVDAPDAEGPLSADEQERWDLCRQGFRQFKQAWYVAARALDIALRGRLWRADHDTAAEFIQAETGMSTSNAYRQMAGSEVAAILASPARRELGAGAALPAAPDGSGDDPTGVEQESNDLSRTRDNDIPHQAPHTAPDGGGTSGTPATAANGAVSVPSVFEQESNDLSRTRDNDIPHQAPHTAPTATVETDRQEEPLVISQRAAEALNPVREDYGAPAAAGVYRAISRATGKQVLSGKVITAVMQQLPRKKDEELTPEQLRERVEVIVAEQDDSRSDPVRELSKYVAAAHKFAQQMAGFPDALHTAAAHDPDATGRLISQLRDHLANVANVLPRE
ncbi:hypothetical protein ACWDRR_25885 [Kitasatospora sp. NPDC003701]